ncbi:Zinc knuckle [Popillia japonica]|uniref:Zinc knuckle n=1 Tax=Popillia japonica TaxID=7064 RepID=A0AAW1JHF7_POPJA
MVISKILSTLPDNYKHFRTAWELIPTEERTLTKLTSKLGVTEERTLTKLTSKLVTEEMMHKSDGHEESVVFNTSERVCFKCKRPGHIEKFCKLKESGEKKCYRCGKEGHFARNCTKA